MLNTLASELQAWTQHVLENTNLWVPRLLCRACVFVITLTKKIMRGAEYLRASLIVCILRERIAPGYVVFLTEDLAAGWNQVS